jgi:hypothetical protein
MRFRGAWCAARLRGAREAFDCIVDGELVGRVIPGEDGEPAVCAEGLEDTLHHVLLVKRCEGWDVSVFEGFYIDDGAAVRALDARPAVRLEFIGGSFISGFGNEAAGIECASVCDSTSAWHAFGPIAARRLGAEYHMVAVSGKGLVREWGWPYMTAPAPFERYYARALRNDTLAWSFESWIPHVAVVSLGRNDFSSRPHPPRAMFIRRYMAFIRQVRRRYGAVSIICMAPHTAPADRYVRDAIDSLRAAGDDYVSAAGYRHIPFKQRGCDWHPNIRAHRRIADALVPRIRKALDQ